MRILLTLSTLFLFLLSACSGADRSALTKADTLMEEYPDSALSILQAMNRSRISESDLPYYALLMTQAQVKTDVPLDSDTLISIAYRKYGDDWWGDKGIRSRFYMGEVFFNRDRPREAMRHYLSAYEESKRLGNDYWHAKSAERIADLFFNAYDYPEAARYRKEAIEYFGKSTRVTNQRFAITDLATDYINESRYDDAIRMLDSVHDLTLREKNEDRLLKEYIQRARIDALVSLGRINEMNDDDLMIIDHPECIPQNLDDKILKLQIENIKNSHEMNDEMMKDLLTSANNDEEKVLAFYASYQYLKSFSTNTIEWKLTDSLLFYQNAIAEKIIKESIKGAERDFYADMAVMNRSNANLQKLITFIILSIVCIAVIVLSRFIRLRNIAHRSELEANIESLVNMKVYSDKIAAEKTALSLEIDDRTAALTALREKIETQNSIIERLGQEANDNIQLIEDMKKEQDETNRHLADMRNLLEEESDEHRKKLQDLQKEFERKNESRNIIIESLFRTKWSTLNRLCEEYYEKGTLRKFNELLIKDIESEVENIGSKDGLRQVEEEVNRYLDGIVSKLRVECEQLKEKDIVLCCLIFAGFSVKAICFILDITTNNFYVRKKRLIQKINDSGVQNKDLFIARL
ncbi:MAG: hypothetical protein K2J58_02675 [Muribaculaceae bacterium]|nr:hypothetical protein [Muribaculaceae bacterium]